MSTKAVVANAVTNNVAQQQKTDPFINAQEVFGDDIVANGEEMFHLGLQFSTGSQGQLDLVEAHKWFNLSALNGYAQAKVNRKELAEQMSSIEVAAAQRAAREWLQSRRTN